jgi:O-antigen/teichoic acid export membrane protein
MKQDFFLHVTLWYMYAARSMKHFLTGSFGSVLTLLVGLVAAPFLIRWLGTEKFGAYRAMLEWVGYLSLLDFGINEALIPVLTKNKRREREAISAALQIHFKLIPLKLAASALLIWLAPSIIDVSGNSTGDLRSAIAVMSISASLLGLFPVFRILVETRQLGYLINNHLTVQSILLNGLALLFAFLHLGITGQALALLLAGLPFYVFVTRFAFKNLPGTGWKSDSQLKKDLWALGRAPTIAGICSRLGFLSDNMVIAVILSASSVTPFFMTQRLVNFVQGILYGVGNASWAALTDIHVRGQDKVFEEKLIELTRVVVILGLISLGPIVAFNRHFITIWVGAEQFGGHWLTVLSAANVLALSLTALWAWVFGTTGKLSKILPINLSFTAVNFSSSLFLTRKLGLLGPPLGTLIALVLVSLWALPWQLSKHFQISPTQIFGALCTPLVILSPPIAGIWWIAQNYFEATWVHTLCGMGLSAILLGSIAWLTILTVEEKSNWKRRLGMK